jgi:hypothetical protein
LTRAISSPSLLPVTAPSQGGRSSNGRPASSWPHPPCSAASPAAFARKFSACAGRFPVKAAAWQPSRGPPPIHGDSCASQNLIHI